MWLGIHARCGNVAGHSCPARCHDSTALTDHPHRCGMALRLPPPRLTQSVSTILNSLAANEFP
jgi:hypothetical protein